MKPTVAPGLVTLHVWRVPRRAVPGALARMALDPRRLRAIPGVRFAKLLGTGTGNGFGIRDADLTRYAALTVWADAGDVAGFDDGPVGRGWARLAVGSARLDLVPVRSRGRWSGVEPFGTPGGGQGGAPGGGRGGASSGGRGGAPGGGRVEGPVVVLTRARLRPLRAATFWRAVPPVAAALARAPGLLARFGIGEAPVGWQGTVSVWRGSTELTDFAYRQPEHREVVERTPIARWYAEDLFARFAVRGVVGDRTVLGWADVGDTRPGESKDVGDTRPGETKEEDTLR